ncbi:sulfatase family protein [Tichowtungia aerotolerans]|uniref:Sulfatase-like hydrolase/transferase n=1 Tax=Tichowtungia aerotolerans TaxID=2697043 RepID=A0A6P1MCM0_9BACT|nr:sulfatase-like hydrolase/transferase [Tichowtungia aerotolerans]QHI69808.1 sulfatase-like hydrolase/transferase [Tichowtungia aerotolerans]
MKWIKNIKRLLVLTVLFPLAGQSAAEKPNVLLILVDDMGYGDVGFNGCKDISTPNIDSIVANGVQFEQGYVTAPQCAPSRAGLLSGMSQSRFGREENKIIDKMGIPASVKQFGDYMHDAGYRTGMVGKWHQGTMEGCHPLDRGFDWFYGFLPGSTFFMPTGKAKYIPHIQENRVPQKVTDYLTFVFGDKAMEFMTQDSEKPFFLYLAFNAPHAPLQAPQEYLDRFEHLTKVPDPINYIERQKLKHPRQVYAAMVSALDDTIGRILTMLREKKMEENTVIWFLSDNGGPTVVTSADNGPLRGEKGDLLEGGARVPFAMQWKGTVPAGQTVKTPVSSLDLLPSSLAAAGATVPENLDGLNLLPVIRDGDDLPERNICWRFPHPPPTPVWAIRSGEWKLVHEAIRTPKPRGFSWGGERTGLYRLSDDIHEDNDLSAQYPEVRERLQKEYDQWNKTLPAEK